MNKITPNKVMNCKIENENNIKNIELKCRIDTLKELEYYKSGGILNYVLNKLLSK